MINNQQNHHNQSSEIQRQRKNFDKDKRKMFQHIKINDIINN